MLTAVKNSVFQSLAIRNMGVYASVSGGYCQGFDNRYRGSGNISSKRLVTSPLFSTDARPPLGVGFLILWFLSAATANAQSQTDIYILAGQSNMVGVAPLAGEPTPQNQGRANDVHLDRRMAAGKRSIKRLRGLRRRSGRIARWPK
jgi:hypothetical protein